MNKEYLEAFKNLKQELYYSPNQIPDIDKWHETIEQALERLEAIDNTNPNRALEILYDCAKLDRDRIERGSRVVTYAEEIEHNEIIKPYYDAIKQALLKAQEQEKILNIIKEKNVDLDEIRANATVKGYNSNIPYYRQSLIDEEFRLVKEWMRYE